MVHRPRTHRLRRILLYASIALLVVLLVCAAAGMEYYHRHPLSWPGEHLRFQAYEPTEQLGRYEAKSNKAYFFITQTYLGRFRDYLPPTSVDLYIPLGSGLIDEGKNYLGNLAYSGHYESAKRHIRFDIEQVQNGAPTTVEFAKGSTLIDITLPTNSITPTQIGSFIDSFEPAELHNIPIQYDAFNGLGG